MTRKKELVEDGAEFEDAGADGFDRDGEGEGCGFVYKENDAIEFAFTGAACEGEAEGVKEVAATEFEFFFEMGDDLLETVGSEGSWVEERKGEFANYVAGGVAGEDGVGFGCLQGMGGVVGENGLQKRDQAAVVHCEMAEMRGGALEKRKMLGGRASGEPGLFLEDGEDVIASEAIDANAVLCDVLFGGHGISVARRWEIRGGLSRLIVGGSAAAGPQAEPVAIMRQSWKAGAGLPHSKVATTWQAMASPRPTASTPSLVFALR
jgi:hypothetical protein